mmetsp:Transcript_9623/g.23328  ORF Transcript_9623/g.23328 Transcript_9623/m.23328 type:complete len:688 (+) Transcript_9623:157-2220(+)
MKTLSLAIAILFCATLLAAPTANGDGIKKTKMKIGLVTASLPWTFGPYQSQMHKLSLLLKETSGDDDIEYDVYWLSYTSKIPNGVYKNYEELRPKIDKTIAPPAGFPIDHITFLGDHDLQMSASKLNGYKMEYGLDCLITLMDVTKLVPDVPLNVPLLAWIPLHSKTVERSTADYWALRHPHAIAGLAPSGAKAINDAVGKKMKFQTSSQPGCTPSQPLIDSYGSVQVDFIPHIFDRIAISSAADTGLEVLKDLSVAEADSKLTGLPLINRGQESTLVADHPRSLFGEETKDKFVILLQGGNYEPEDRKGWDTSIQAFARFYHAQDDPSKIHLHIHSMESYLIASDANGFQDPPAQLMPKGLNLRMALHDYDLPPDAYTMDIAVHAPEVVAAYKKRASICLHPSKVEGFGMNVMECQAVGTPVITTNYTAMGDFTKLGRSVPPQQMIKSPGVLYNMALPDVAGIAEALEEMYQEHLAMQQGTKEALARRESEIARFNEWIDNTCSPAVVGRKFKSLLLLSYSEFYNRQLATQKLFSGAPPVSGAYEILSGYHLGIADWDAPWTLLAPDGFTVVNPMELNKQAWMMLLNVQANNPVPRVLVLPAKYDDGADVPFVDANGKISDDLPVLVSTVVVTSLQTTMTRRQSIVGAAFNTAGGRPDGMLPPGLAIVKRNGKPDTEYVRRPFDEL